MRNDANAYFTVEAAMIFPLIMSGMMLGIYLFCFQYDRCLLEQDMGSLILWCRDRALQDTVESGDLEEQIRLRTSEIYKDKYVAWELSSVDVRLRKNDIYVSGAGCVTFPIPGWNLWNSSNLWRAKADYTSTRLSPVFYIRQYRKFE